MALRFAWRPASSWSTFVGNGRGGSDQPQVEQAAAEDSVAEEDSRYDGS